MKKLLGIFAVSALTILGCTTAFASNSVQGDADTDGILTAKDSAYVLQKTLDSTFKVPMADEEYSVYCDVNGDKVVNADDASLILQKVLNDSVKFAPIGGSTETTTETTTVTTTETSTETTTEPTTKATATSSSKKYYDEYSDVLDYGTFSGANLVDKMTVELSDFKSHSYIYDFKYDESRFSGLDKVVETYAEQVEKTGWKVTAMAEAEEAGIITLICTKDDRILSFGTNFYDKKIMVEVIKSSKNAELLNKMLEESK